MVACRMVRVVCRYAYSLASVSIFFGFILSLMQVRGMHPCWDYPDACLMLPAALPVDCVVLFVSRASVMGPRLLNRLAWFRSNYNLAVTESKVSDVYAVGGLIVMHLIVTNCHHSNWYEVPAPHPAATILTCVMRTLTSSCVLHITTSLTGPCTCCAVLCSA
jgi:hypothetical protein